MKEILKLKTPLLINGQEIKELSYDCEEITSLQFARACSLKTKGATVSIAGAAELDYSLHLYLGFEAIIALNKDVDISDLERLKGADVMQVMRIGRNFMKMDSEDDSQASNSEEPLEILQEPLALQ